MINILSNYNLIILKPIEDKAYFIINHKIQQ